MRRSILILICDFLVVSTLSLVPDGQLASESLQGHPSSPEQTDGFEAGQTSPSAEEDEGTFVNALLEQQADADRRATEAEAKVQGLTLQLETDLRARTASEARLEELEARVQSIGSQLETEQSSNAELQKTLQESAARQQELEKLPQEKTELTTRLQQSQQESSDLQLDLTSERGKLAGLEAELEARRLEVVNLQERLRAEQERNKLDVSGKADSTPSSGQGRGKTPWEHIGTPSFLQLKISMKEADLFVSTADTFQADLDLPVVNVGDSAFLVSEWSSLGLSWGEINDGELTVVRYLVARRGDGARSDCTVNLFRALSNEPRVSILPLCPRIISPGHGFTPIGMEELRRRGAETLYVFKKDNLGSYVPARPFFSSSRAHIRFDNSWSQWLASTEAIAPGDYVMTGDSRFVGVMVSKVDCYVLPVTEDELRSTLNIPIDRQAGFKGFLEGVQRVKQRQIDLKLK